MSDPVSAAVFSATLVEVAVAAALIVPAYWRPCRWPVLIVSMLLVPPLLCLRTATGLVVLAIHAAMWGGVWRRVAGWRTVSMATAAVALVLPLSVEIHRGMLTRVANFQRTYPQQDLSERLRYETRFPQPSEQTSIAAASVVPAHEHAPAVNQTHRAQSLKALHDGTFARFVAAGGFGIGRMMYHWERSLTLPDFDSRPLPKPAPEPPAYPADVVSTVQSPPAAAIVPPLSEKEGGAGAHSGKSSLLSENVHAAGPPAYQALAVKKHRQAEAAFLDPEAWGYVAGNQTAVGFEPHAFRQSRNLSEPSGFVVNDGWRLVSLQLVSLLKHERPMAYVSAKLPNMQDLGQVPVRPLEPFETTALESLRTGQEIVIESRTNRINMLGPIRAVQACLACHSVREGTLLGAFSYRLDRESPLVEPKSSDLR